MNQPIHIEVGDKIVLPGNPEFLEDVFIVTCVRPHVDTWMIDAFCDGQEDIYISIGIENVELY